ncbi:hypothetical protein DL768_001490 [Monosporascus sp. mg162]|nr:hypothetical protein DL768_001490 [Monosporascus sp. mg162]
MAEPFGIVAGALGVAGLFNNCVDCFEYVQLGRRFGRDYERCQLRLDIAKARLGRWGEAVKINDDPRFQSGAPIDKSVQLAQSIIEEILLLFESARKTSKRYELVADQQDLVVFEDKDMKPVGRALHKRLKEFAYRRQKHTSLVKKAAWALYDGKSLEKIIDQVASFVDELEKAFPVEAVCYELAETEVKEVEDEASLTMLKDAARGIDAALSDAAAQKIDAIAGRNAAKDIRIEDRARVHLGNVFTEVALHREILIRDQTTNSVETVVAKGEAGIQIGNTYGASSPPSGCVIAGDFNAGDISWNSDNPDYHGGAALANTMAEHGLDPISEPDVPTHDDGNVLDRAFSDIPIAEAAVNEAFTALRATRR